MVIHKSTLKTVMALLATAVLLSATVMLGRGQAKVVVCHKPGGFDQQTLEIDEVSLADHLGHGDLEGECAPLQETIAYVCSTSNFVYAPLYVSSEAGKSQNGTVERPFGSVSAALEYAENKSFPAVELQIAPGTYGDDLAVVSRPTRIVGPGQNADPGIELSLSIVNDGGHDLGIQGVVFQAADSGPAITVTGLAADTALCDVRFEGVIGHAFSQTGGTVSIEGSDFNATARDPAASSDDFQTGTALILAEGVTGTLRDLHVDESTGSGLYVSGPDTRVEVDWDGSSQSVFENGTGCLGAVVVKDGAELNASHLTLYRNGARDIDIDGSGTTVNLPFLSATFTQVIGGGLDEMAEICGFNAVVSVVTRSGTTLDISGTAANPFIISDSDLGGLLMTGIEPPIITLTEGVISNNKVGITIDPVYPRPCQDYLDALSDTGVRFINNVLDLDSPCLNPPPPLPELACSNGVDDDQDGLIDCDDPDCTGAPGCGP